MDAALVELVEHDVRKSADERILLQPRRQDAFGRHEQARVLCESRLEPDVPADLAADRPAALVGDPRAIERAATRRGCSSSTRPRRTSAGGTRVVLPAPGAAVTTTARRSRGAHVAGECIDGKRRHRT